MDAPVTQLDERFSDPGTEPTTWAAAQAVLESAQLSWISTVRADGRPHVSPLVAVWLDGTLHFSTGPTEQKAVNLATNPHVVVTTGCNTWDDGLDVMVEGEARRVTDPATVAAMAARWAEGGWPARVDDSGVALTAEFSAPSAGPPPWLVYQLTPLRATALETVEPGGATRWTFPS